MNGDAEPEQSSDVKKAKDSAAFKNVLMLETGHPGKMIKYRLSTMYENETADPQSEMWLDVRVFNNGESTPFGLLLTRKEIETIGIRLSRYPEVKEVEAIITENLEEPDLSRITRITKRSSENGQMFLQIGQEWGPVDEELHKRKSRGISLFKKEISDVGKVLMELSKLLKSAAGTREQIKDYGLVFYGSLIAQMPGLEHISADHAMLAMMRRATFWTQYHFLKALEGEVINKLRTEVLKREAAVIKETAVLHGFEFLARMFLKFEENWDDDLEWDV